MKRYAAILAIVALAVPIGVAEAKVGNDSSQGSPQSCNPGEWVKVTVVEPNGDTDTTELRGKLPEGYSTTSTGDGPKVTINSDGSVEARAGSTVECTAPH